MASSEVFRKFAREIIHYTLFGETAEKSKTKADDLHLSRGPMQEVYQQMSSTMQNETNVASATLEKIKYN